MSRHLQSQSGIYFNFHKDFTGNPKYCLDFFRIRVKNGLMMMVAGKKKLVCLTVECFIVSQVCGSPSSVHTGGPPLLLPCRDHVRDGVAGGGHDVPVR